VGSLVGLGLAFGGGGKDEVEESDDEEKKDKNSEEVEVDYEALILAAQQKNDVATATGLRKERDELEARKQLGTTEESESALNELRAAATHQQLKKFKGCVKLILAYLQVMTLLQESLSGVKWPQLYEQSASSTSFATFDLASIMPSGCMSSQFLKLDFVARFYFAVLLPFLIVTVIFISMRITVMYYKGNPSTQKNMKDQHITAFLGFTFLVYPGLSQVILQIFNCRHIEGDYFLVQDVSVQCFTPDWWNTAAVAFTALVVYCFGIPFGLYITLQRNRHKCHTPSMVLRYGFIYEFYHKDFIFGDLIDLMHKFFVTGVIMFFFPGTMLQVGGGLLVQYIFLVHHCRHFPFYDKSLNFVQTIAHTAIAWTLFCATMIQALDCSTALRLGDDNEEMIAYQALLCIVNVLALVLMVVVTVYDGLLSEKDTIYEILEGYISIVISPCRDKEDIDEYDSEQEEESRIQEGRSSRTKGINALRINESMAVVTELACTIEAVAPEADINRNQLQSMAACFHTCMEAFLCQFEQDREAQMRLRAERPDELAWPPCTMLGLQLSKHVVSSLIEEARGAENVVDKMQETFVSEHSQSIKESEDDNALDVELRTERIGGIVADNVMRQALDVLEDEFTRIHDSALNCILENIDQDARSTAMHMFNRAAVDGEIYDVRELKIVVAQIMDVYGNYLDIPTRYDQIIQQAANWLQTSVSMSTDDFACWFNANFNVHIKLAEVDTDKNPDDGALDVNSAVVAAAVWSNANVDTSAELHHNCPEEVFYVALYHECW
jgi:hypothetical protein